MQQWELLVTEGHVRAACWRAAAGIIAAIGVILIALGLIGLHLLPENIASVHLANAKQQFVTAQRQALDRFLASKGAPPVQPPPDAAKAFTPSQVFALIEGIVQRLNESESFSPDMMKLEPDAFWRGEWTPGKISGVSTKRNILVGFYINETGAYPSFQQGVPPVTLRRVFGLFHRPENGKNWAFYCLSVPRAAACGDGTPLSPDTIPATMRDLTPKGARP